MMKRLITIAVLLLGAVQALAQNVTVSGSVYDDTGETLPGVIIVAKNAKGQTVETSTSDAVGAYSITCPAGSDLEFHFLGFETFTFKADGKRKRVDVDLQPDASRTLDEAVAVGYGAVKKRDLTGSVVNVKMAELRDVPLLSIDQALQGKVAGLDVTSTDGEPGSDAILRIRGTRSITASNDPLIVVDGIADIVTSLNDINPSDIEAISVLKDASATAIYGSRGSNGVIIITTKGTSDNDPVQSVSVTVRAQGGFSQLPGSLDLMDATQFSLYRNQYYQLQGVSASMNLETPVSGLSVKNPMDRGTGTDWIGSVSRVAPYQNYLISLSAHQGKQKVYASLSYNDEQGIIVKSGKQNYTGVLNLSNKLFPWLTVGANLRYQFREQQNNLTSIGGAGTHYSAIYLSPLSNPSDSHNPLNTSGSAIDNPVERLKGITNNTDRSMLTIAGSAKIDTGNGIKWEGKASYYRFDREIYRYFSSSLASHVEGEGGGAYRQDWMERKINLEHRLEFSRELGGGNHFDIMFGQTLYSFFNQYLTLEGEGYLIDEQKWTNMGAVPDKNTFGADSDEVTKLKLAHFARANYNYKSRYYLTLTGRFDGASHFAENQKWGFFPSAAVRWNIANEPFLRNARWIDNLSLRFSAGTSGNDLNAARRSLANLSSSTSGYLFNGSQPVSYYMSRIASPNLTWEKTTEYNAALDGTFFNNRLSFTLEAYLAKTRDLLLTIRTPQQTGYTSRYGNLGMTTSYGIEFTVDSRNIVKRNFTWTSSFTVSHNTSMVNDIGTESFISVRNSPEGGYMNVGYVVGYPINSFWGFQYAGVWHDKEEVARNKVTHAYANQLASNELGYPIYLDLNHDGTLDSSDLTWLGSADPIIHGGLQNTFRVRNLSIGFFFFYTLGGKVLNYAEYYLAGSRRTNQYAYMINAWHPVTNPDSNLPRAGIIGASAMPSSFLVHDASYLRLKNVSIGYRFSLKSKLVKELELTLSGDNLYLWSTYNGFDPDVTGWGTKHYDVAAYPKPRRVVFSVQLKY